MQKNNSEKRNINEIQPGLLLLNPINETVLINDAPVALKGVFVIKFENATVLIGNRTCQQEEFSIIKPLPVILKSDLSIYGNKDLIEQVHELHIENLKFIETIKRDGYISITILTGIIMLILFLTIRKTPWKKYYLSLLRI